MVADGVRQRKVVVAWGGHVAVLDECEVQVAVEGLLHRGHILDESDAANTDLFALLFVVMLNRSIVWEAVLSLRKKHK